MFNNWPVNCWKCNKGFSWAGTSWLQEVHHWVNPDTQIHNVQKNLGSKAPHWHFCSHPIDRSKYCGRDQSDWMGESSLEGGAAGSAGKGCGQWFSVSHMVARCLVTIPYQTVYLHAQDHWKKYICIMLISFNPVSEMLKSYFLWK